MNIKRIILSALMISATCFSSFAVAGVPTNMLEGLDKAAAATLGGVLGAGIGIEAGAKGAEFGATLGAAGGPLGAIVGGAVGGVAGAVTGYAGLVMTKALYNEIKRPH